MGRTIFQKEGVKVKATVKAKLEMKATEVKAEIETQKVKVKAKARTQKQKVKTN